MEPDFFTTDVYLLFREHIESGILVVDIVGIIDSYINCEQNRVLERVARNFSRDFLSVVLKYCLKADLIFNQSTNRKLVRGLSVLYLQKFGEFRDFVKSQYDNESFVFCQFSSLLTEFVTGILTKKSIFQIRPDSWFIHPFSTETFVVLNIYLGKELCQEIRAKQIASRRNLRLPLPAVDSNFKINEYLETYRVSIGQTFLETDSSECI